MTHNRVVEGGLSLRISSPLVSIRVLLLPARPMDILSKSQHEVRMICDALQYTPTLVWTIIVTCTWKLCIQEPQVGDRKLNGRFNVQLDAFWQIGFSGKRQDGVVCGDLRGPRW